MQTRSIRKLGVVIFLLAVFLGLGLTFAAIWSAFEGFSYFNTGAGYPSFGGLKCPILMTRSEKGMVTASFNNPAGQELDPYYEVAVSGPYSSHNFEGQLSLPAHTTKSIQWTVDAEDIDLGNFIFVDLQVLPVAGYSTREDTCGIMVLDIAGSSGGQLFNISLAVSLIGLLLGLGLWESTININIDRYINLRRALGIMVLLALLTGIMRLWAAGLIFSILAILLLVINLRLFIEGR